MDASGSVTQILARNSGMRETDSEVGEVRNEGFERANVGFAIGVVLSVNLRRVA